MTALANALRHGISAFALVALLGAGTTVNVPTQTVITVHVKGEISSSHAQPGDDVPLVVADNVVVNGMVVMQKGADGLASIDTVTPANGATPGSVTLKFRWVRAIDGSKIGVNGEHAGQGHAASANTSATDTLADTTNAANSAGSASVANVLARAHNVLGSFGSHPKASDASITPQQTISLSVRNPNGVTIVSSVKAPPGEDADVK